MDVIFFYYYKLYKDFFKAEDPHYYAVAAISGVVFYSLIAIAGWVLTILFCYDISITIWMLTAGAVLISNSIYFKARWKRIVKEKPAFWGSEKVSKWITFIFTLIGVFFLFAGAIINKILIQNCK